MKREVITYKNFLMIFKFNKYYLTKKVQIDKICNQKFKMILLQATKKI